MFARFPRLGTALSPGCGAASDFPEVTEDTVLTPHGRSPRSKRPPPAPRQ